MSSVQFRAVLAPGASKKRKEVEPLHSVKPNWLLAGYLACEFLNQGTLLGEKFDPARAEAVGLADSPVDCKRMKPDVAPSRINQTQSYADVANLLKMDGAHLPGIVNPAQLARWIKM